jgi:DNA uptake protein ComE-like DNA-binding protein
MNDRIKDYFSFSKKEQRGLIILLGLMLFSISANIILPALIPDDEYDISPFRQDVAEFMRSVEIQDSIRSAESFGKTDRFMEHKPPALAAFISSPFHFDPNTLEEKDWEGMGMDPKITKNILRYREKGGKFRDSEGFRNIYGMNDELFAILSPYIRIEKKQSAYQTIKSGTDFREKEPFAANAEREQVLIELNSTDSASLLALPGIGPSFAGRIIKYRNKLGGFQHKEQLLEVNGLDSARFNLFCKQVTTDTALIQKIDINTVTFKDLLKHPYFEYYLVKAVFNKKDELKNYDSIGQLRSLPVMYEELYDKISPYLEVK